ncbi:BTB/POZ domain-containing protein [Phthorimaea operculella]|nr:BTB/POZ domain-containing protein [Phthorimaea operculella]
MIELKKLFESDNLMYSIKFTNEALNKNETYPCSGSNTWQVYEIYAGNLKSEVVMDLTLDISSNTCGLFSSLRDDSNLTDFELNGDDGSVKVHKTILAGLSPFVKTMLDNSGQWAEVTSNSLKVPNATQETLEHLKDYIYLQKMPDSGIEQLAALASYFLMSDLEQRCAAKLLFTLCPENAAQFLDFAVKYKIRMLVLAIMEAVHKEVIKVNDIDMLFVKEKKN